VVRIDKSSRVYNIKSLRYDGFSLLFSFSPSPVGTWYFRIYLNSIGQLWKCEPDMSEREWKGVVINVVVEDTD